MRRIELPLDRVTDPVVRECLEILQRAHHDSLLVGVLGGYFEWQIPASGNVDVPHSLGYVPSFVTIVWKNTASAVEHNGYFDNGETIRLVAPGPCTVRAYVGRNARETFRG